MNLDAVRDKPYCTVCKKHVSEMFAVGIMVSRCRVSNYQRKQKFESATSACAKCISKLELPPAFRKALRAALTRCSNNVIEVYAYFDDPKARNSE